MVRAVRSLQGIVRMGAVVAACWLEAPGAARSGPPAPDTQPSPECMRRAESAGFSELVSRLLRLPIDDRRTLRDWIGERADVEVALREAAWQLRHVDSLSAGPASCRVQVSIAIAELARNWARRARAGGLLDDVQLERLRLWSLRADQGRLVAVAVASAAAPGAAASAPVGWEHLSASSLRVAAQAARADAVEQMLVRCGDLQVSATETLADVFAVYPALETALRERLESHVTAGVSFEPFGIASCRFELPRDLVVQWLGTDAQGVAPHVDLSALEDPTAPPTIEVVGLSTPPPAHLVSPAAGPVAHPPAWAADVLTAVGWSKPLPVAGAASESTLTDATAQARIDAVRNMWSQVDELVLPDGSRVRTRITAHPEIGPELAELERRMSVAAEPVLDARRRLVVKLAMPLGPLWDVLARTFTEHMPMPAASSRPAGGQVPHR